MIEAVCISEIIFQLDNMVMYPRKPSSSYSLPSEYETSKRESTFIMQGGVLANSLPHESINHCESPKTLNNMTAV
jgi:hypothetical protein